MKNVQEILRVNLMKKCLGEGEFDEKYSGEGEFDEKMFRRG